MDLSRSSATTTGRAASDADPEVIGKVVQVGNDPVTIIGVTPPEFYGLFPGTEIDISLPMMFVGAAMIADKEILVVPGCGPAQARCFSRTGASGTQCDLPTFHGRDFGVEPKCGAMLSPASNSRRRAKDWTRCGGSSPGRLQALMAIVALVLLIACANVANLLLARARRGAKSSPFGWRWARAAGG